MSTFKLHEAGIDYEKVIARFLDDKDKLFESVHEIIGSSGNADMTTLYTASCQLTNLLRSKDYSEQQLNTAYITFENAYIETKEGIRRAEED